MDPQPDLSNAIVSLAGAVVGSVATVFIAIIHNRFRRDKLKSDFELGADARKLSWVEIQLNSMQVRIDDVTKEREGDREYYQQVIEKIHQQHREEMAQQETHCQTRLDALTRELSRLDRQLQFYTTEIQAPGACVKPAVDNEQNT